MSFHSSAVLSNAKSQSRRKVVIEQRIKNKQYAQGQARTNICVQCKKSMPLTGAFSACCISCNGRVHHRCAVTKIGDEVMCLSCKSGTVDSANSSYSSIGHMEAKRCADPSMPTISSPRNKMTKLIKQAASVKIGRPLSPTVDSVHYASKIRISLREGNCTITSGVLDRDNGLERNNGHGLENNSGSIVSGGNTMVKNNCLPTGSNYCRLPRPNLPVKFAIKPSVKHNGPKTSERTVASETLSSVCPSSTTPNSDGSDDEDEVMEQHLKINRDEQLKQLHSGASRRANKNMCVTFAGTSRTKPRGPKN